MASMREIKRRKASIASTQQITKAMKLVSTVKLQRAKGKAEATKPYFDCMYDTVATMLSKSGNVDHPYLKSGASSKKAVITITSNRGLAGGYNNNIVKLITGDETFDTEKDLRIFDPIETWKKTRYKAGTYEMRELLVEVFRNGECVYESPNVMEMREYCLKEQDTVWEESRRLVNPHKVYVDLSDKLFDMKKKLLSEYSR